MKNLQTMLIPHKFPGLNEVTQGNRTHWSKGASTKKEYTQLAATYAKVQLKPVSSPIMIGWRWLEANKKRDPDNITSAKKFILDGLKEAGIIPSDGQKWIKGWLYETWEVAGKDRQIGVIIDIKEIDGLS